ncbi:hypothetical protein [Acetobacterium wieringae]|uniref:hypothetical protein n=1 Tax=Acetobacterium wieringae TaxID=52694 RepID=UPI0026ECFD05|nr:hypothetical protein [Acetobacterium wieringae]
MVQRYSQLCPMAFGAGAVNTTGDVAKELGFNRILIVTDENVEKIGTCMGLTISATYPQEIGIEVANAVETGFVAAYQLV